MHTPGKKGPSKHERNAIFDHFDLYVVKRTVMDFYVDEKTVPTCNKFLPLIREKIHMPWAKQSLRRILHTIGF